MALKLLPLQLHFNARIFFFLYLENANHAHWMIFCLLLLAGLNIPISEDLMLMEAGLSPVLASPITR